MVRLRDAPPATVVKFRARSSRPGVPGEDDAVPGEVCTLGTVSVTARCGPGEASLLLLTCARVVGDQGKHEPPGRNPAYPVFGACADFPELRENFVKLIREADPSVSRHRRGSGKQSAGHAGGDRAGRGASTTIAVTSSSRTNREVGTKAGTKRRSGPGCFSMWLSWSYRELYAQWSRGIPAGRVFRVVAHSPNISYSASGAAGASSPHEASTPDHHEEETSSHGARECTSARSDGPERRLSSIRCGSGVRVVGRFRERWGSYGTAGVSTRYARSALRCDPGG